VDHEFHESLTIDDRAFIVALAKHLSTRANRYHPSADRLMRRKPSLGAMAH
jgi:hypothetical protein